MRKPHTGPIINMSVALIFSVLSITIATLGDASNIIKVIAYASLVFWCVVFFTSTLPAIQRDREYKETKPKTFDDHDIW